MRNRLRRDQYRAVFIITLLVASFISQAEDETLSRDVNKSEIIKYVRLIKNKIAKNWSLPAGSANNLNCAIKASLLQNGDVMMVKTIRSSGDPAFDKSVITAVYRAVPLPVPSVESGLFAEFREITFDFSPPKM